TVGYPDLIFTPWVLKRSEPLTAYGPRGLRKMTEHIEKAWGKDVYVRTHGLEEANRTGYEVVVHEIAPGVVYRDANVKVTAFLVKHGIWDQAYGYRFDTADRRIVISGDTAPAESVVQACDGCDVLLHEIYDPKREELHDPHWQEYFKTFHTSPQELGEIARRAHPKLRCFITRCWESCRNRIWWSRCGRLIRESLFRRRTWGFIDADRLETGQARLLQRGKEMTGTHLINTPFRALLV